MGVEGCRLGFITYCDGTSCLMAMVDVHVEPQMSLPLVLFAEDMK